MKEKALRRFNKDNSISEWNERPPLPGSLNIEVASACHHQCIFCTYHSPLLEKPRKSQIMDTELLEHLIVQAAKEKIGYNEIGFHMTGEPLLYKELPKCVKLAKSLGFQYIFATSNGDVEFETIKAVVDAGLDSIRFSINGATAESYKAVHGRDSLERVKNNVIMLSNYRKEMGRDLQISISMVVTKKTLGEEVLLRSMFQDIVDEIVVYPVMYIDRFLPSLVQDYALPEEGPQSFEYTPCPTAFNSLYISCEGDVVPCCRATMGEEMIIANVKDYETLSEIWWGEKYTNLRKNFIAEKNIPEFCKDCPFINRKKEICLD